jgi:hypothetical protein
MELAVVVGYDAKDSAAQPYENMRTLAPARLFLRARDSSIHRTPPPSRINTTCNASTEEGKSQRSFHAPRRHPAQDAPGLRGRTSAG